MSSNILASCLRSLVFGFIAALPHKTLGQDLQLYLYKSSIICIAANSSKYIAAQTFDFTLVVPSDCPKIPQNEGGIGNEYLTLPKGGNESPEEPEAIVVLINQFDCIENLASQIVDRDDGELVHIDLSTCKVLD